MTVHGPLTAAVMADYVRQYPSELTDGRRRDLLDAVIDLADRASRHTDCNPRTRDILQKVIAHAAVMRLRIDCPRSPSGDDRRHLCALLTLAEDVADAYAKASPRDGYSTATALAQDLMDAVDRVTLPWDLRMPVSDAVSILQEIEEGSA